MSADRSVLHDPVLGRSQRSRMTLPSESTRVNSVAGVHFQVISAGNTPEIVTICGMVDILSIDACQISNPRKSVAGTFHKNQINCDNIRIPDSALVRVKVMTLGPESTMTPLLQYTGKSSFCVKK